jgi:tetratricopeptide (TPR) repeat protein
MIMTKAIRLLSAVLVSTLLGAALTLGQEPPSPPQEEPTAAPEPEAPAQEAQESTSAPTTESYERGLRYYRNRNFTQALQELGTVAAAEPDRADVLYLMGYCHYILKHFEDSLSAFRRTFEVDPDFDPRGIYQPRYRPEGF